MIRHAARGVPWLLLAVTGALLVVLLQVVAHWPYTTWPLEGCAVGLLAGGAAWCFDEPAAAVVDTVPRHLAWRTAARALGLLVLLGLWSLAVSLARHGLFGHSRDVAAQGVAAALAAAAYATWRRAGGVATPGRRTSGAVVPAATFLALARPAAAAVPLFPYTAAGNWTASALLWGVVAVLATFALAGTLLDLPWRLHHR